MFLVTVIVVIIRIIATLYTSSIISKPIVRVMERMKLIRYGDLSHEALTVNTRGHDHCDERNEC